MSIQLRCPQCRKTLTVPDQSEGKKARCPGCQTIVAIPEKGPSPSERAADPVPRTSPSSAVSGGQEPGSEPFLGSVKFYVELVAGLITVVSAVVGIVFFFGSDSQNPDGANPPDNSRRAHVQKPGQPGGPSNSEKPTGTGPKGEKPKEEQPKAEQPNGEKPAGETPKEEKPKEEKPTEPPKPRVVYADSSGAKNSVMTVTIPEDAGGEPDHFTSRTGVVEARYSPDGKFLVSRADHSIALWDTKTGKFVREFLFPEGEKLLDFAIDGEGRWLLAGGGSGRSSSERGKLWLWDLRTGKLLKESPFWTHEKARIGYGSVVHSVAISPDGKWGLALCRRFSYSFPSFGSQGGGAATVLFDLPMIESKKLAKSIGSTHGGTQGNPKESACAFTPDGKRAVICTSGYNGRNREYLLWESAEATSPKLTSLTVGWLSLFRDGKRGLTWSRGNGVSLYNFEENRPEKNFSHKAVTGYARCADLSRDGRFFATGTTTDVHLWNATTGKLILTIEGLGVSDVAFAPDGDSLMVVGGGRMKLIRLNGAGG